MIPTAETLPVLDAEIVEPDPTDEQIELAVVRGITSGVLVLTPTGISIAEDTSFDQWREGLKFVKWFQTKLVIGAADYIAFGTRKFGADKVSQALEQLEFSIPFVKTAMAINAIPVDLRRANLNGDHYAELARAHISRAQQARWAKTASEQTLTPTQLRFSIDADEVVDRAATRAQQSGVVTLQGIRQQFDVWLKRVGGMAEIANLTKGEQEEILGELESMLLLGAELTSHITRVTASAE